MSPRLLVAALALFAAGAAPAQPVGGEFRVNEFSSAVSYAPSVAMDKGGNFVVAWRGYFAGSDVAGILARRFSASGAPLGGQFQVNTTTTDQQIDPTVASAPDGSFVVAWTSRNQPVPGEGTIMARRYAASGAPIGGEVRISTATTEDETNPAIAVIGDKFVVVWRRGLTRDIVGGQRVDASGALLGTDFVVNPDTTKRNLLCYPRIGSDPAGDFIVVWNATDVGKFTIEARRYDANGTPLTPEFRVTASTNTYDPAVALSQNGSFVVVWQKAGLGISGRRFDASGTPLDSDFRVSTYSTGDIHAAVASDAAGNFVVTWVSTRLGSPDVFARRFFSNGAPNGGEFLVNTYTGGSQYGSFSGTQATNPIAMNPNGAHVAVWTERNGVTIYGVYGQRFSGGVPGDVSGEGSLSVADIFWLINWLFAGGPPPLGPADANGDGKLDVQDVFYLISALFAGGPPPH